MFTHLPFTRMCLWIYHLSGLASGAAESHTEYNVVQSALQKDHHVLTSLAFHLLSLGVVVTERFLQYAIDEFCFLLLT